MKISDLSLKKERFSVRSVTILMLLIFFVNISGVSIDALSSSRSFSDVLHKDWFYEDVTMLIDKGIVNGYVDDTFRPKNTVSVAEFLKMSILANNVTLIPDDSSWSGTYVTTALTYGYMSTDTFNDFNRPITRAEIAFLIDRMLGLSVSNRDIYAKGIVDYRMIFTNYRNSMVDVFAAGIVTGYPDGKVMPQSNATRAEASVMVMRMIDKNRRKPYQLPDSEHSNTTIIDESNELKEVQASLEAPVTSINLGMSFESAKVMLGNTYTRIKSQFGYDWYIYKEDYSAMHFVGVANNKVVAYYNNSSFVVEGVGVGSRENTVASQLNTIKEKTYLVKTIGDKVYNFYLDENNEVDGVLVSLASYTTQRVNDLSTVNGMEQIMTYLTNGVRVKRGLTPYQWSDGAADVAYAHSVYLQTLTALTHQSANGDNSETRMKKAGLPMYPGYYGENVSKGYKDPFSMHYALLISFYHRVNLLHDKMTHMGVGVYYVANDDFKFYVTQDFYKLK